MNMGREVLQEREEVPRMLRILRQRTATATNTAEEMPGLAVIFGCETVRKGRFFGQGAHSNSAPPRTPPGAADFRRFVSLRASGALRSARAGALALIRVVHIFASCQECLFDTCNYCAMQQA